MPLATFAAAIALASCLPPQRPIVAEVVYDATGDDTGWEFVELFNPGAAAVALAGLRLEAGDGAAAGRWTLRWTGTARDTVRAGARFVVGGAKVTPAPDAVVTLELQNGPDAMRLVWPDGAVEVVGWGALQFPEYFCGAPASDVPPGRSLARVPDDADRGSNALDFREATPSPGRANLARLDAALVPGALTVTPPRPAAGEAARLAGAATAAGADSIAAGAATLEVAAREAGGATATTASSLPALVPGDTVAFALDLPALDAGRWTVVAHVRLAGDEVAADDADSVEVAVGPCALAVTEIQFHPAAGEGEWVEVLNQADHAVDLAAYTLSDRGDTRAALSGGAGALAPESLAVVAQDRDALLAHNPALDARRVWKGAPWAALNNRDDSTGVADAVVVREDGDLPCARVDYSAAGVPAGVPIEWRDGGWWPALDPAGTPLKPPLPALPLATRFELAPRRLRAGARARLAWALPWPRAHVAVDVYDLAGRRVARALEDAAVAPRASVEWDVSQLAPGLYLVALRARADAGGATLTETRALRVDGVAP